MYIYKIIFKSLKKCDFPFVCPLDAVVRRAWKYGLAGHPWAMAWGTQVAYAYDLHKLYILLLLLLLQR